MLTKKLDDLTLEEIHEELEAAAIDRKFKKLPDAQNFIQKLVQKGTILADDGVIESYGTANDNPQLKSAKEAKKAPKAASVPSAQKKGKAAGKPTAKAEKAPKVRKEAKTYDFQPHQYDGTRAYTARGKGTVNGFDKTHGVFRVELGNGKTTLTRNPKAKAVDDKYRERYTHDNEVRTESGAVSIHTDDDVSNALLGLTHAELGSIAKENGLKDRWVDWQSRLINPKTGETNYGMCRMNLGTTLRGMVRKGQKVTIIGKSLKDAAKDRHAEALEAAESRKNVKAAPKAKAEKAPKKATPKAAGKKVKPASGDAAAQ